MDLTSLVIGGLAGGIVGASLAAVVVGWLARGKQIDERQEETRNAVGGFDAGGEGRRDAEGAGGGLPVWRPVRPGDLRGGKPGAAGSTVGCICSRVVDLEARCRDLEERYDESSDLLAQMNEAMHRDRLAREGGAWVRSEAGPDVEALERVQGVAT